MKRVLFMIIVILLIPIYLIICFLNGSIKIAQDLFEPITEGMQIITENMFEFWRRVLKVKDKK